MEEIQSHSCVVKFREDPPRHVIPPQSEGNSLFRNKGYQDSLSDGQAYETHRKWHNFSVITDTNIVISLVELFITTDPYECCLELGEAILPSQVILLP